MPELRENTRPSSPIPGPEYDRSRVRVGIVHFGVGGFHRAHEAMYLDRLMNAGDGLDWGICGVGVMPFDLRMRDVLHAQDGLFILVEKHPTAAGTAGDRLDRGLPATPRTTRRR